MAKMNLGRVVPLARGNYSSTTSYKKLDFVLYEGASYICNNDCSGIAPTNTTYWQPISLRGLQGETGATGAQGERGQQGNSGVASADGVAVVTDFSNPSSIPDDTTTQVQVAGAKATATKLSELAQETYKLKEELFVKETTTNTLSIDSTISPAYPNVNIGKISVMSSGSQVTNIYNIEGFEKVKHSYSGVATTIHCVLFYSQKPTKESVSGVVKVCEYDNTSGTIELDVPNGAKYVAILSNTLSSSVTASKTQFTTSKTQDKLVSGTNIKTINKESILGTGNINTHITKNVFTKPDEVDIINESYPRKDYGLIAGIAGGTQKTVIYDVEDKNVLRIQYKNVSTTLHCVIFYSGMPIKDSRQGVIQNGVIGFDSQQGTQDFIIPSGAKYAAVLKNVIVDASVAKEIAAVEYLDEKVEALSVKSVYVDDKPMISLIDDDFQDMNDINRLVSLCDELGVKCTFALIPNYDNNMMNPTIDETRLNKAKELEEKGYTFAMHPNHELFYLGPRIGTFADCEKNLVQTQRCFNNAGLIGASDILVWPGSSDTRPNYVDGVATGANEYLRPLANKHVKLGIHAGEYAGSMLNTKSNYMRDMMRRFPFDSHGGTEEQIKANLDAFVQGGKGWLIIITHIWTYRTDITEETVINGTTYFPMSRLENLLGYAVSLANENNIPFVTIQDGYRRKMETEYLPSIKFG